MRIAIVCNDTRGGVQPYVALGLGLLKAGFSVQAVAPEGLSKLFTEAGIRVQPLSGGAEEMQSFIGQVAEKGSLATMQLAARELPRRIETWTKQALAGCEGADIVTGGVGGMVIALSVAEKLGAPFVQTHLQPIGLRTSAYQGVMSPLVPGWMGAPGRLASHLISDLAVWTPFLPAMQQARKNALGLSGRARASDGQPVFYGFSPKVAPIAAPRRVATGYWTAPTPSAWQPPEGLNDFLDERHGPIVSIGFGSMASENQERTTELVVAAVQRAGIRAVLLSGAGGFEPTTVGPTTVGNEIFFVDSVPHDWLFARVSAVVHHGGAGTTGAGLASGKPAIVVPFTMDQPFWACRVQSLGVGRQLSSDRLAAAIRQALDDEGMRSRARAIGEAIRSEDGVAVVVSEISRMRVGMNAI